ncbi:hypothetical protein BP5796_08910 [Coleophoma crateriformis]|uniref:C2H2-type domain-containing protein n=1 Tax=Coleophoma crateriformis TaxID=565419 RepID=A0A3D8R2H9_9HELO|nr:hypothetical protein BP5796_08910 [Coleophoma crateriformis]
MGTSSTSSVGKAYACTEPGCPKSFVRSEHLSRHRLNHRPKRIYACPQCPKKFVRPDLYQRHKDRHEKGMWYRNVGGVLEGLAEVASPPLQRDPSGSVEPQYISPTAKANYQGHSFQESRTNPCQLENIDPALPAASSSNVNININHHTYAYIAEASGAYISPPESRKPLFCEDLAGTQHFPESPEWLFDVPLQESMSSFNAMNANAIPPAPSYAPGAAPPLSIATQTPTSPQFQDHENIWLIVQSK